MTDVELGLYHLYPLAPEASAECLWVLLTGYPFPTLESQRWGEVEHRLLGNARHLLPHFRGPYRWQSALERYRLLDEQVRAYKVADNLSQFAPRPVSIASDRFDLYEQTLQGPLPYFAQSVPWAKAGDYLFDAGERVHDVAIPEELLFPSPQGHDLEGKRQRPAIIIPWSDLLETAGWMDEETAQRGLPEKSWENRLQRVELQLFDQSGQNLIDAQSLPLDGMMHLIGMVSSGKSTLMDVLAVWMARNGHHITLVVGDVIGALNRAQQFADLGLTAAPMLGASNRARHAERLHRVLAAERRDSPLLHQHIGFQWLSTACPLDGLRRTAEPIPLKQQPCTILAPADKNEPKAGRKKGPSRLACPLYAVCPSQRGQRDLVSAQIWIATPASLIFTRVAPQLNAERLRFAELVARRSDLVIFDEADQVQGQFDTMFSPHQTLVGQGSGAWLGDLWQKVVPMLNVEGRGQLANAYVGVWCQAHETAQTVANAIYGLILQETALQKKLRQGHYFTDWLLFEQLALDLSGASPDQRREHQGYNTLRRNFERFLDDPLGEGQDHPLVNLAYQVISMTNKERLRRGLKEWLTANRAAGVELDKARLNGLALQLEFALLVAILQNRINLMVQYWHQVEGPLQLGRNGTMFFQRPPDDFAPLIPTAPMGNVLAFQYVPSSDRSDKPGDLRFFRCMGVGRWLLTNFHRLFSGDGLAGPHALLLSGTSCAGKSASYHIQAPVGGILRAPEREIVAIEQSRFQFKYFSDEAGNPIRVSGTYGNHRLVALRQLLKQLASPGKLGGPSPFEFERQQLSAGRQRILILVGSYVEAEAARLYLDELRPDWRGQVLSLAPDDESFEDDWQGSHRRLRRGLVHQLSQTDAWILIAPLLAVERGHNILNQERQAAIGAAYFLVRPHPRPDDIGFAIQSINRWAVDRHQDTLWLDRKTANKPLTLSTVGLTFRREAYKQWRYLLNLPVIYSTLPDNEREAVAWSQLVTIWQVIGRLIRGGSPARVYFCDAAFAGRTAGGEETGDEPATSLLVGFKSVLQPYFNPDPNSKITPQERALVRALYGPFYQALAAIGGLADAGQIQ